jgi:hypothetical protein
LGAAIMAAKVSGGAAHGSSPNSRRARFLRVIAFFWELPNARGDAYRSSINSETGA